MRSLAWGFFLLAVVSCGSINSNFGDAGGGDATVDGTANDSGLNFGDTGSGGDGSGCARGCSSDLHDVIDCNGNVVQQCSGSDGCDVANGTCINACQAAVDNKNSVGCEYYATQMDTSEGSGYC